MCDNATCKQTLDEVAEEAGGYVRYIPGEPLVVEADYRAMSRYCIERGITSDELTEDEYNMFLYNEPLIYA
ncbi:MAG: hypothetical protein FWE83_03355 [Oscillospiraceae bacterium]|nr:hypothetical protein [Oscillospiraceae bacterium]